MTAFIFRAPFSRHFMLGVIFLHFLKIIELSGDHSDGTLGTSVLFCCLELSADEIQTVQLLHMFRPSREQIDTGGPNVGVA